VIIYSCERNCDKRISPLLFEHEINGSHNEGEGYKIIPAERLFQIKDGKEAEYGEGHYFLDGFQLKAAKAGLFSETVGRYHKAVFEEGDTPADEDYFPDGYVLIFQVSVPGEGHECVGNEEEDDGAHGAKVEKKVNRPKRAGRLLQVSTFLSCLGVVSLKRSLF
jgi:hypothetical protein